MLLTLAPWPETEIDPTQPISFQLHDLFEQAFPPNRNSETLLRNLNCDFPLAGLFSWIESGEISRCQWLLYVATCVQGQICNGGLEGFVSNCPGLVLDAEKLFEELGQVELLDIYRDVTSAIRATIIAAQLRGESRSSRLELRRFWEEWEVADTGMDEAKCRVLEQWFFKSDIGSLPNPVHNLIADVFAQVKAAPQDLFFR